MSIQRAAPGTTGHLRAVLRVEPHPEAGCFVAQIGEEGDDVTHDLVCWDADCVNCECRAEIQVSSGSTRQFVAGDVNDRCICPVFRRYDCLPSIDSFDGAELIVSLILPAREELTEIVSELREAGAAVQLDRLTKSSSEGEESVLELEVNGITEKQREAVRTAIECGYYETPRRADLGDLAEELDVSRSAVSQRLGAVESKLVTELFRAEHGSHEERNLVRGD